MDSILTEESQNLLSSMQSWFNEMSRHNHIKIDSYCEKLQVLIKNNFGVKEEN